ncbi:histidine phosphatase family protein [Microlunatus speluncae]|uniref:histidine phosphatase family protein n=1 Tax=Microlunatus speluncae TaxID=2594267 RepID=UPI001266174B|nr:histidine phosphatase family protein [Microlunatus speluncae]
MSRDGTKIIFVRHGDAVITTPGMPRSLTELGRRQAQALVPALSHRVIIAIWSSSMLRAKQTAEIIGAALGLPINPDDRLRERRDEDPAPGVTAENDDPATVLHRLLSIVTEASVRHRSQTVLFVTHGGITALGLSSRCHNLSRQYVDANPLINTAVSEITVDPSGVWTCLTWNGQPVPVGTGGSTP